MKRLLTMLACATFLVAPLINADINSAIDHKKRPAAKAPGALLHMPFVENRGQVNAEVGYYTAVPGADVYVTRSGDLVLSLAAAYADGPQRIVLRESFAGDVDSEPVGTTLAITRVNHFVGDDPDRWRTDIPTFESVSFGEVFEGIEVELRSSARTVEKLFHVRPGANPGAIVTEVIGADSLAVEADGRLALQTLAGPVYFSAPLAHQVIDGERHSVDVAYRVADNRYGFAVGDYDMTHDLLIDPVLASYIGGAAIDEGKAIVAIGGEVLVAGSTESTGFAGLARAGSDTEIFVARLDADLTEFRAATFLGGGGSDEATSLAVHPGSGDVYVAGLTDSSDFPDGSSGVATGRGGGTDAFIARLDSTLTLTGARYLGGSDVDDANAVAIRAVGGSPADMIYVAGHTLSNDFPISAMAFDPNHGENTDEAFVTRLTPDLSILTSTYLGNRADDWAYALAVHPSPPYDVYVAGRTSFEPGQPLDIGDFPGIPPEDFNGEVDAYVARMNDTLTDLLAATYVGGPRIEFGHGLTIDPTGTDVYVAGGTICAEDPFAGSGDWIDPVDGIYATCGGAEDAFVARLDAADLTQTNATYIGGGQVDRAYDVEFHDSNSVILFGRTRSTDIPFTTGGLIPAADGWDLFLARLSPTLTVHYMSTYFGGNGVDEVYGPGLAVTDMHAYVTGQTDALSFPGIAATSAQPVLGGSTDAFVARLHYTLTDFVPNDPDIDVVPLAHHFGELAVSGGPSPTLSVRIANIGAGTLGINDMSLGSATTDFTVDYEAGDGPPCNTSSLALAPGSSCTVGIAFQPSKIGAQQVAFNITSNSPGEGVVAVIVSGEGSADLQIHGRWEIDVVDSAVESVDIAVDSTERAHLCYYTPSSPSSFVPALVHAVTGPGLDKGWVREDIDTDVDLLGGNDCVIVIASDDSVHVAYTAKGELRYRRKAGELWKVVDVVEPENVVGNIDLGVFDVAPYDVRILYHTMDPTPPNSAQARIAVSVDAGWARTTIEEGFSLDFGYWNRFVDLTDRFVYGRSYLEGEEVMFRIAELASLPPDLLTVRSVAAEWPSSAASPRSAAHLNVTEPCLFTPGAGCRVMTTVFLDQTDGALRYLRHSLPEEPLSGELAEYFPPLRIEYAADGVDGRVSHEAAHLSMAPLDPVDPAYELSQQVAFYDPTIGAILYSTQPLLDGPVRLQAGTPIITNVIDVMTTEVIDDDGDVGVSVELDVDGDGAQHLAYLDRTNQTVRYAHRIAPDGAIISLWPRRWLFEPPLGERELRGIVIKNVGSESLEILSIGMTSADLDNWLLVEDCDDAFRDSGEPFVGATLEPGQIRAACVLFSSETTTRSDATVTVDTSVGSVVAAQSRLIGKAVDTGPVVVDSDNDGVPDDVEQGPCCATPVPRCLDERRCACPFVDGDRQRCVGTDHTDPHAAGLFTFRDESDPDYDYYYVRIVATPETGVPASPVSLTDVRVNDPAEYLETGDGDPPSDAEIDAWREQYPYGFFGFTVSGPADASEHAFEVRIELPSYDVTGWDGAPRPVSYQKYGEEVHIGPDNNLYYDPPELYRFDWDIYTPTPILGEEHYAYRWVGADFVDGDPDFILLRLREGQLPGGPDTGIINQYPGDSDLEINGVVVDPGGPTMVEPIAPFTFGTGSESDRCFIATAAYGSYLAPEVQVLRDFRDERLMHSAVGRRLVAFYYATSPPVAEFIGAHDGARTAMRWALTPVVYAVKYPGGALLLMVMALVPLLRLRARYTRLSPGKAGLG